MRIEFQSLDRLSKRMEKFEGDLDEIVGRALYKAAGVMADEVRQQVNSIPTENGRWGTKNHPLVGPESSEKDIIRDSMGIARHRKTGNGVETSVGFKAGGAKLARQVESGTSYMKKTPFMRRAERAAKGKAVEAAEQELNKQIRKILGE